MRKKTSDLPKLTTRLSSWRSSFGLLGFLVAKSLKLPAELALGVILVGAVPGAMASNLAKADVAFSIALSSASPFLSPILTPRFTYLFTHSFIEIKFLPMFFSIIKVILPLVLGLGLKHYFGEKREKIIKVFPAGSTLLLLLSVVWWLL